MTTTLYSVRKELKEFISTHKDKKVGDLETELKDLLNFTIQETWKEAQREIDENT